MTEKKFTNMFMLATLLLVIYVAVLQTANYLEQTAIPTHNYTNACVRDIQQCTYPRHTLTSTEVAHKQCLVNPY